jgi:ubiquinone/menaquinone biosynthesis C-methylase UbiE
LLKFVNQFKIIGISFRFLSNFFATASKNFKMNKTDYNKIAETYNKRYSTNYLPGIEAKLNQLISLNKYKNILEAGSGTGRWISSFDENTLNTFGLDYSYEMIKISKNSKSNLKVINADADYIPFKDNFFDLIFCVNAIHHFPDKELFIKESKRVLSGNGMIAVFGVDPHLDKDWYVYKCFDNVYENDLKRFLSLEQLKNLLTNSGFKQIQVKAVEKVSGKRIGNDVFNDPFLEKHSNSQLANLSNQEYQAGIKKIKKQIKQNPETVFTTKVIFYLISAVKL